jgi:beta-galactosidase
MNLGVCYYPEHWHESRWVQDAQLLHGAGLTLVRMGEFAWSRIEPVPNQFHFDWLDRAIEIFADSGFQIVLGTPTASPPAWLTLTHPGTLPVDEQGRRRNFGGRRHYCPNSSLFREYTSRVVAAIASRYGADPRIIGWQIDNEFGQGDTARCYCENCASAFQVWLKEKYRSLDALNQAWGNVFWSQEYSSWSQINAPILTSTNSPNPSHILDYYRFASDSFVAYQQLQMDALRSSALPAQFITHNFMCLFPDLDQFKLAQPLSFVSWDSYPTGHAEVMPSILQNADNDSYAYDVGNPYLTGLAHDVVRGSKNGLPFWVMEQQAGFVNWATYNPTPRPGTMHLWLWHNFASGANATLLFRERATLFAQEQYHSGLLKHDGTPAQGYLDLLSFREQHSLMQSLDDTRVENEVAILISYDDLWAIQTQPHRRDFSYWNLVLTWHAALLRAGVPCDVISTASDLSKYKLVIAPTLHIADDSLAARLRAFVQKGGLAVIGIRSGFKTPTNLVTAQPLPGALRELVGATITSWQPLPPSVSQPIALMWRGWQKINATRWIETLETDTAGAVATFVNTHLDGQPAMTVNQVGAGRVMYVGWYPDQTQADALVGMLLPEAQIEPLGILPQGVIAGRRVRPNETYWFLLNFTDDEKRIWLNGEAWHDAANDMPLSHELTLSTRGSRVLKRTK